MKISLLVYIMLTTSFLSHTGQSLVGLGGITQQDKHQQNTFMIDKFWVYGNFIGRIFGILWITAFGALTGYKLFIGQIDLSLLIAFVATATPIILSVVSAKSKD